jgi:hypothetical protein
VEEEEEERRMRCAEGCESEPKQVQEHLGGSGCRNGVRARWSVRVETPELELKADSTSTPLQSAIHSTTIRPEPSPYTHSATNIFDPQRHESSLL